MSKKEEIQRTAERCASDFRSMGLEVDEKYLSVCIRDAVYNAMPEEEANKIFHGDND